MLPARHTVAQALHHGTAMFDLRYALRQLARSPGFAAVALLTLTLGMGANTAFFSVLYGVVLRQPPYPGAERLVTLHNALAGADCEWWAALAGGVPGLSGPPARV